jgi:hypothetical protein
MDALDEPDRVTRLHAFCQERGLEILEISSVTGLGIKELINHLGYRLETMQSENKEVKTDFQAV